MLRVRIWLIIWLILWYLLFTPFSTSSVLLKSLSYKVEEFIYRYVFEATSIIIRKKPLEYFFVGIFFALEVWLFRAFNGFFVKMHKICSCILEDGLSYLFYVSLLLLKVHRVALFWLIQITLCWWIWGTIHFLFAIICHKILN